MLGDFAMMEVRFKTNRSVVYACLLLRVQLRSILMINLAKRDTETDNTFNIDKYDRGLKGYSGKARGIDVWTSTELAALPKEGKALMADAMEKPMKKMAQPIQNLINLNAMLGKP